jgi:hypothetical protein
VKISLDFDKTYSEDPKFWDAVVRLAEAHGHEVVCLTMRRPDEAIEMPCEIIYTARRAKAIFARENDIKINVWIDDSPHWLLNDG